MVSASSLAALVVVPARLGSTRLPRKMLLRETGRYLFEYPVASAARTGLARRVVLATDSEEILDAAAEAGIEAVLTSPAHTSGTDRVREAVGLLSAGAPEAASAAGAAGTPDSPGAWDVIVNVQGDEVELSDEDLRALLAAFADPAVELATLAAPLGSPGDHADPAVVKVLVDADGWALYFSRAALPFTAHGTALEESEAAWRQARHHVGVYAFRPEALERFCALGPSPLERVEKLEQLRWLEAGGRIRVLAAASAPRGIDTEADYRAFVERERAAHGAPGTP